MPTKLCRWCSEPFERGKFAKSVYCSDACRSGRNRAHARPIRMLRADEPVPNGRPRRYANRRGYIRLRWRLVDGSYVEALEHRVKLGLPDGKHVHHRDRNPENNSISNLEALTPAEHSRLHAVCSPAIEQAAACAIAMRRAGATLPAIAALLKKNSGSVYRMILRRCNGIDPIDSRIKGNKAKVDVSAVAIRLRAGERPDTIARSLGLKSGTAIRRIQKEYNITPHRPGRPARK